MRKACSSSGVRSIGSFRLIRAQHSRRRRSARARARRSLAPPRADPSPASSHVDVRLGSEPGALAACIGPGPAGVGGLRGLDVGAAGEDVEGLAVAHGREGVEVLPIPNPQAIGLIEQSAREVLLDARTRCAGGARHRRGGARARRHRRRVALGLGRRGGAGQRRSLQRAHHPARVAQVDGRPRALVHRSPAARSRVAAVPRAP